MQIQYSFNLYNSMAESGITIALKKLMPCKEGAPVVVCIGSDLSVGDSLGPICGTKLKSKLKGTNCYVYGTLSKPVTAHEVKYINEFVRATHPGSPVIAIDAAVGNEGDIGLIKLSRRGVRPGSGANKRLSKVGDLSVLGIIAEKSMFNFSLLSATRLNIVYKMADIISEGLACYIFDCLAETAHGKHCGGKSPAAEG